MKVVELLIDEDENILENGGTAIALVNMPAHEAPFFQFNKDGKVIELTEEDQELALQQFASLGEDSNEFMMRGYFIKSVEEVGEYINVGLLQEKFAESNVASSLKEKSIMDQTIDGVSYKVRFKYATRPGRPAILSTSRKFCKDMIGANKIYRLEDINAINNGFAAKYGKGGPKVTANDSEFFDNNADWGNTFFRFGGPNCGHIWVKLTYQEIFKTNKKTGDKEKVKDQLIEAQSRDDAALIAGSNMNEKTQANPSPATIKRAGLGQFAKEDIRLNDYPEAAKENAKRVLKYLEETGNPNNCLTQVGKVRANQLANGENLSEETLNRMKSFLSRHAGNERKGGANAYDEGCSNLAIDAWGGLEILPWVEKKLNQLQQFKFAEEQKMKQCLAGPILIPDKLIYRSDKVFGEEYYVYFSKETCERIAYKYLRDKNQSNINLEHDPNKPLEDVTLVESWIVSDPKNDKSNLYGYELPEGTWFGIVQVKDEDVFEKYVESGKTKGFSLEGFFASKLVKFNDTKNDTDVYILSEIEKLIQE